MLLEVYLGMGIATIILFAIKIKISKNFLKITYKDKHKPTIFHTYLNIAIASFIPLINIILFAFIVIAICDGNNSSVEISLNSEDEEEV